MNNLDVREFIKANNIRQYEVADLLKISEFTFSRKLRKELSNEEKEKIFKLISENKKGEN